MIIGKLNENSEILNVNIWLDSDKVEISNFYIILRLSANTHGLLLSVSEKYDSEQLLVKKHSSF